MTADAVCAYITASATVSDLDVLTHLRNLRRTLLDTVVGSGFREGDGVVVHGMKKDFNGLSGTVSALDKTGKGVVFAHLSLDAASATRYSNSRTGRTNGPSDELEGIPLNCLSAA